MSNDAKLGLVLGVAIVLVIGLVFFRNDTLEARVPAERAGTTTAEKKEQAPPTSPATQIGVAQP